MTIRFSKDEMQKERICPNNWQLMCGKEQHKKVIK